jgi:glycerol-3-phosphate dehydrogenase (NAD(P)+)
MVDKGISESASANAKITILGAGSWGATLAWLLGGNGKQVTLWSHDPRKTEQLRGDRLIEKPLSVRIPDEVNITARLDEAVSEAELVIFCCTAQTMRELAEEVNRVFSQSPVASGTAKVSATKQELQKPVLISAAKGIELHTTARMSEVLKQSVPGYPVAAMSGPNLAAEILQGLPAATVIASDDLNVARRAQSALSLQTFRVYSNDDLPGVELGGALKNVMAIAAGVVDGLNLGTNAKAALMTRGLAEIARISVALGAKAATLAGLSGMGDLVATCYSSLSRNYRLGHWLAEGRTLTEAENGLGAVAEGVTTTEAVCELSQKLGIEMPIAQQVQATLTGNTTPRKAIMTLMTRPLASE